MQYPLTEKIGNPDLLVGREKEFKQFGKWITNIPKRLSKSRVIIARRKSGKTSFVQIISLCKSINYVWLIHSFDYEISVETAEMYLTWGEYIDKTVNEVNDQNAKNI